MMQIMRQKEVQLALGWYNHRINKGMPSYASKVGWFFYCSFIHQSILPEDWQGDGITTLLGEDESLKEFIAEHHSRIPVMGLAEEISDLICGRVLDDNLEIGRLSAAHFMERQFRKVVFSTHDCWATHPRAKH